MPYPDWHKNGENMHNQWAKEEKLEKIREEEILSKVRRMRKDRNKVRKVEDETEDEADNSNG